MKRSKFSEAQIAFVLKQAGAMAQFRAELREPVAECNSILSRDDE